MQAAFAAGADIVELDVHPTTDGKFAVFHDWTLDCRTEGTGETRAHDMAYLQDARRRLRLHRGWRQDLPAARQGRRHDAGACREVLTAIPDGRFLVNFKTNEAREGDMLRDLRRRESEWAAAVWGAYGGDPPTMRAKQLMPRPRGLVAQGADRLPAAIRGMAGPASCPALAATPR